MIKDNHKTYFPKYFEDINVDTITDYESFEEYLYFKEWNYSAYVDTSAKNICFQEELSFEEKTDSDYTLLTSNKIN